MGKSSKKTAPKAEAEVEVVAPAVAAKTRKKGKREAEEAEEVIEKTPNKDVEEEVIEKEVSNKKQKKGVAVKEVTVKKVEVTTEKKKNKKPQTASTKSSSEEEESSEDDKKDSNKTPKKNDSGVEARANTEKSVLSSEKKEAKTSSAPRPKKFGSKTLLMGNVSFNAEKADVEKFFKDCGKVVDVRFATRRDGVRKGFADVEFATVEAAEKALSEKNGKDLAGRAVSLDIAVESGPYTPRSRNQMRSNGSQPGWMIYVRGFDKNVEENEIKDALREHFSSCGEVTRIGVPRDENGLKGYAYIDFTSSDAINSALGLDQSELNEYPISVQEAKPRDYSSNSGVRFNDVGRTGGGFNDCGRRAGCFDGRCGDRGGGRGSLSGTGKKTTFGFGDD